MVLENKVFNFSLESIDLKNFLFLNVKKRLYKSLLQLCLFIFILYYIYFAFQYLANYTALITVSIVCMIFIINLFVKDYIEIRSNIFKDPYLREEKTLIFDEDKITLKQSHLQMIIDWKNIHYVVFRKNIYFLGKHSEVLFLIPKKIFSSKEDIISFQENISKKTKIKGGIS